MAQRNDRERLNELLAARNFGAALPIAERWAHAAPRDAAAWFSLARAAFGLGRLALADEAIERTVRLGATAPDVTLVRAMVDHRLGRSDAAIGRLRGLISRRPPNAVDATLVLAEVLHRAHRREELAELVAAGGAWLEDPRAVVFSARVAARDDPAAAADRLDAFARGPAPPPVRRIAGFEAVRLLDAAGAFVRAFELATHLHATTGEPFDVDGLVDETKRQVAALGRLSRPPSPRATPVGGVAIVVGMPRSGTTLLEQMLDRHPAISGLGEFDGIATLGNALVARGAWPDALATLPAAEAERLRNEYLAGAAANRRAGTDWTFDKGLHAWRWLPAIAAVLPGAVGLRIVRDERDTAISLYLSNFHPGSFGWTRSLDSIERVVAAERTLAPLALRALGIPHEEIRYEELVDRPREQMERILGRLGLPWADGTLAPEANARTVLTLSHEQVRRPVNRASIGRWRNYAFAFRT